MLFKCKHNDDTLNNVIYSAGLLIIYVQTVCSFITPFTPAGMLVTDRHEYYVRSLNGKATKESAKLYISLDK